MNIRKTNGIITISSYDYKNQLYTRHYMFYNLDIAKQLFKTELFLHNNKLRSAKHV